MKPLRKILFPTDLSPVSENAFHYVLRFAKKINAKVIALHVIWPASESMDYPSMVAQATRHELKISEKLLKKFINRGVETVFGSGANSNIEKDVIIGSADTEIIRFLNEEEVDLVVMGGKKTDRTPLLNLLGGVATNVVKNSPCPVLVIPENVQYKEVESAVYAGNLMEADPYEIWQAANILKAYDLYIHYVHFSKAAEQMEKDLKKLEQMKSFFAGHKVDQQIIFQQLEGADVERSLMDYLTDYGGDMLIMLRTHESYLYKMLNKSTTQNMIRRANVPVLIMTKKDQ